MVLPARTVAAVLVAGMAALTVSACSTPSATAAATVGDSTIAESTIFEQTTALLDQSADSGAAAPSPALVADVNRSNTTQAIRGRLLRAAAADAGVVVTDADVNAALASGRENTASLLNVTDSSLDEAVRDRLLLEGLAQRLPADGAPVTNVTVRVDGVGVTSRDEAVVLRAQFAADPAAADAAVAGSGTAVPDTSLSLLTNPDAGPAGVFLARPGEVIIYPNADGFLVLRILDRTVEEAALTADQILGQQVRSGANLAALLLVPYAEQQGVEVNPRLGTWDPLALQVVPGSMA